MRQADLAQSYLGVTAILKTGNLSRPQFSNRSVNTSYRRVTHSRMMRVTAVRAPSKFAGRSMREDQLELRNGHRQTTDTSSTAPHPPSQGFVAHIRPLFSFPSERKQKQFKKKKHTREEGSQGCCPTAHLVSESMGQSSLERKKKQERKKRGRGRRGGRALRFVTDAQIREDNRRCPVVLRLTSS